MALRDPIAVYNAANNMEAHLVRNALVASGIEAHVTEDLSRAGTWVGGVISEIHKPQIWVDQTDVERAKSVLEDFERRAAERRNATAETTEGAPPIEVVCGECGERSSFPASQRDSVQECPHCLAYVDVEETEAEE
jgi:hypothetical protein